MRGTGKVCECLCSRAAHARGRAGARRQKNKKKTNGKNGTSESPDAPPYSTNECGRSLFDKKSKRMAAPAPHPRRLLIAVDDSPECEHALVWALANVYR